MCNFVDRMANRPAELENRNVSGQDAENSGSNSDIAAETTLFEQIAVQIHRYRGNFRYFQRLPGILNLLELVSERQKRSPHIVSDEPIEFDAGFLRLIFDLFGEHC